MSTLKFSMLISRKGGPGCHGSKMADPRWRPKWRAKISKWRIVRSKMADKNFKMAEKIQNGGSLDPRWREKISKWRENQ
jgi:hypothetical protein